MRWSSDRWANPRARIEATERAPAVVYYMAGARHPINLPTYHEVVYHDLWPGTDLAFRVAAYTPLLRLRTRLL